MDYHYLKRTPHQPNKQLQTLFKCWQSPINCYSALFCFFGLFILSTFNQKDNCFNSDGINNKPIRCISTNTLLAIGTAYVFLKTLSTAINFCYQTYNPTISNNSPASLPPI